MRTIIEEDEKYITLQKNQKREERRGTMWITWLRQRLLRAWRKLGERRTSLGGGGGPLGKKGGRQRNRIAEISLNIGGYP